VVSIGLGLAWSLVLPFNKSMWTGSFALVATGLALVALALCLVLLDGLKLRAWSRPFVWLGANPLAIYALSELLGHLLDRPWLRRGGALVGVKDVIFWRGLVPLVGDAGGMRSSLLYAVLYASLWLGVAAVLQRRGISLRA
jgi:predicted acyltransferase